MEDSALTPKQDAFAQAYVETSNASEAYRRTCNVSPETTDKSIWESASRMMSNPKVSSRIMELQAEHALRHNVTIDSLTAELDEDRELARTEKQASAAITAVMGKAKLHGLITDKKELGGVGGEPIQVTIGNKDAALL